MSSGFHTVSKAEAAERQLRQVIRLFFQRADAVAIHTLAAAAYQILIDLCEHKGVKRELEDSTILDELGVKADVLAAVRAPQNFFKHADRDPEGSVRFNPTLSAYLILYGVHYLHSLNGSQSAEGQVFRVWFFLRFPDRAPVEVRELLSELPPEADPDDYSLFLELIELQRRRANHGVQPRGPQAARG